MMINGATGEVHACTGKMRLVRPRLLTSSVPGCYISDRHLFLKYNDRYRQYKEKIDPFSLPYGDQSLKISVTIRYGIVSLTNANPITDPDAVPSHPDPVNETIVLTVL